MTMPATEQPRFRPAPHSAARWEVRGGAISLSRSVVMGILNVTPDSFSDGGLHFGPQASAARGAAMIDEGADIVDVGGESTRPGAGPVDEIEQIRRTAPTIEALAPLASERGVAISIDTTRAAVARAALDAGASIVNDVSGGLDDPALLEVVAEHGAGVVLMHRLVAPRDDRYSDRHARPPQYGDVVRDVRDALLRRRDAALAAGIPASAIAVDPGLGFGKDVVQNLRLVARLDAIVEAHPIVLVGASRKSFIGATAAGPDGLPVPSSRLPGSLAVATLARCGGAAIFRVHDVAETRQALALVDAVRATTDESTATGSAPRR